MAYNDQNQVPAEFICPISQAIMEDPVMTVTGHSYERIFIEQWLSENDTNPVDNVILENKTLTSNYALKSLIENYQKRLKDKQNNQNQNNNANVNQASQQQPLQPQQNSLLFQQPPQNQHQPDQNQSSIEGAIEEANSCGKAKNFIQSLFS